MVNKKQEWEQSRKEWGFGRTKIDNFLDKKTVYELYEECKNAPKGGWTVFTRAGSRMEEFNDLLQKLLITKYETQPHIGRTWLL